MRLEGFDMTMQSRPEQMGILLKAAIVRLVVGILIMGLLLFLCAGDLGYWNAWLFLAALTASLVCLGAYLYKNDPALLRKRLQAKEKERAQAGFVVIGGLSMLIGFSLCGLDYRFGWSHVSTPAVLIALVCMLAGFGLFLLTLVQNSFASRVVEVQQGQRVIDTGVYGVIRHPMYTATCTMLLAASVVLGSWYAVLPMCLYVVGIVLRIRNEEQVLLKGLPGYGEYLEQVRYRLIPFVW
jgi:protein-S-isoprenylcysteine O-methyltransferase Ste14